MDGLPERFHILALVLLVDLRYSDPRDFEIPLDKARIFLLDRAQVTKGYWSEADLLPLGFGKDRVDVLFPW